MSLNFVVWERLKQSKSASIFTNNTQERSLLFSPRFCEFECNGTSDWLNLPKTDFKFSVAFILSPANAFNGPIWTIQYAFNMDHFKILSFGKEFSHLYSKSAYTAIEMAGNQCVTTRGFDRKDACAST